MKSLRFQRVCSPSPRQVAYTALPAAVGTQPKPPVVQPELIFRRPVGLLQRERTHDQHLAFQLLSGHIVAVGAVEQLQLCLRFPEGVDEAVQHSGVTLHRKLVIAVAGRNEGGCGPCFV